MKTTLYFVLTLLTFTVLAFVPNSFARDDSPEYIVRLYYMVPSDQEPLPDIDATLNEMIKNAQLAFAELMENHEFDRKSFTYETDADENAVVHLTFIRVMVTLLTALPKSVSCYENVICFQKVSS